ncbi:DNA repair exonuclease [Paenibacillus sp. J5C_2022]|uniref:metallophosphoesterase family protein n=1 Tax=Paenibacillus sp. J5C2022 TaxID=2977129 RepID=UPI0021D28950|nr:DNA repair exonuclease [Paenibacillus sp. J5C2022]MCU6709533.1 DNA repair exonuclease [Paenibacillus sp. J5C2022]
MSVTVPFRFLHAADLHLDSPFRGLSKAPAAVRSALEQSTFSALKALTELAIREEVDFVVVAGDLYDEADSSLRAQLALAREWSKLHEHGIAVFAIHGNHDHMGGQRAKLKLPESVHIFGPEAMSGQPAYRRSGELAAYIYGQSYGRRAVTDNIAASYRPSAEAPFHIALLHANVGGDPSHDAYAPCTLRELTAGGFHYWALGHIHTRAILHQYPHVVYPGNVQGRHPRETGSRGCYIVDVSRSGDVQLDFRPLDAVRWIEGAISINGIPDEGELLDKLLEVSYELASREDGRPVMIRLKLTGEGMLHSKLADGAILADMLESLQAEHATEEETSAWIFVYELEQHTREQLDWRALEEEESFAGEMLRLAGRLQRDEAAWQSFAREALSSIAAHPKLGHLQRGKWNDPSKEWLEQAIRLAVGHIVRHSGAGRE